jgi:hypothetical protein
VIFEDPQIFIHAISIKHPKLLNNISEFLNINYIKKNNKNIIKNETIKYIKIKP